MSSSRPREYPVLVCQAAPPTPSTAATAYSTSEASDSRARSTSQTPSAEGIHEFCSDLESQACLAAAGGACEGDDVPMGVERNLAYERDIVFAPDEACALSR